jgi:hypothetical protein
VYIAPPPPAPATPPADVQPGPKSGPVGTEADKLRSHYKAIGDAQGHTFGVGLPGSKPPDFNFKPPPAAGPGATQGPGAGGRGPGTAGPGATQGPGAGGRGPSPAPPGGSSQR